MNPSLARWRAGLWISPRPAAGLAHRRRFDHRSSRRAPSDGHGRRKFPRPPFQRRKLTTTAKLRRELEASRYRISAPNSDTEVLHIHLYAEHGRTCCAGCAACMSSSDLGRAQAASFSSRAYPFGIRARSTMADDWHHPALCIPGQALLCREKMDRKADPAGQSAFNVWGAVPEAVHAIPWNLAIPAGQLVPGFKPRQKRTPLVTSTCGSKYWLMQEAQGRPDRIPRRWRQASEAIRDSVRRALMSDVPGQRVSVGWARLQPW